MDIFLEENMDEEDKLFAAAVMEAKSSSDMERAMKILMEEYKPKPSLSASEAVITGTTVTSTKFDSGRIMEISKPERYIRLPPRGLASYFLESVETWTPPDQDVIQETQTEENEEMAKTKEDLKIAIVNDSVVPGLDAMISAATGGKVIDFRKFAEEVNGSDEMIKTLQENLDKMKSRMSKMKSKPVPITGTEVVNAEELTYQLVYRKAADVFGVKKLFMEIPTLVWMDKAGTVVHHPEVPSIDENYQMTFDNLVKFLTAYSKDMNTWLYGHTGTGKSTFVEQVAARIGFPVSRLNLDSNMERADLVGHIALREKGGTTVSEYEEGILPRAMQRPGFLLLDEIDAGRPDILFVIQRALEGSGLMITEESGRIVKPHPLFRFVATANTRGQGDETGIYSGTRNLNASMVDRFPVFIEFKYLDKTTEMKLLNMNHPELDDKMAEQMVVFANEVRSAFSNGELFQPITPRGLNRLAELFLYFKDIDVKNPMKTALEMTVYDKTTRDTIQRVRELADRCLKVA